MTQHPFSCDRSAFERYLDVVNRAMLEVRSQFPYGSVIGALQLELDRRSFVISIQGDDPSDATVVGCVLAELVFRWIPVVPQDPAARWALRRDHMMDALEAPWRYIADPKRIELPPFSLLGTLEPNRETTASTADAPRRTSPRPDDILRATHTSRRLDPSGRPAQPAR